MYASMAVWAGVTVGVYLCVGGWMGGCVGVCVGGWMCGSVYECEGVWVYGFVYACTRVWVGETRARHTLMDVWMNGNMD